MFNTNVTGFDVRIWILLKHFRYLIKTFQLFPKNWSIFYLRVVPSGGGIWNLYFLFLYKGMVFTPFFWFITPPNKFWRENAFPKRTKGFLTGKWFSRHSPGTVLPDWSDPTPMGIESWYWADCCHYCGPAGAPGGGCPLRLVQPSFESFYIKQI